MADIAPGLNFRIGADVKNLNRAIREAERSLKGAVASFSSIGNSLSLALSAPILAFGAASIKAAGDIESLRFAMEGTMKDAGRSIDEAHKELEALRVAALAPGLDFKQAVQGSVRLQSVGFEAERAREIIVQLANALALSGGTADQLDGVTRQFAQMHAKGKVMQDDLRIILENMPALAGVMKKEFGTTSAEMLRKMGVDSAEFIDKLTAKMKDLPRASGGIANAIVNATNAVQLALASIGEELNKTFGISKAMDGFATSVSGIATWFKNLDEGTKRLIAGFAVFAVTLGPAFKLMQGGVWIVGQLHLAFLGLQKVLAQSMAGQAIPSLIAKWKALDFAMKASIIGATVAVVLALAAAFVVLQKDMSASAQAARAVAEVNKLAADSVSEARAKTEYLVEVIKDENAGYKEKQGALKKLNEIAPEYFKGLSIERSSIEDLNKAYDSYIESILRAARAKAGEEKLIALDKEAIALAEKKNRLSIESAVGSKYEGMGLGALSQRQNEALSIKGELIKRTDEEIAANKAAMDAVKGLIKANTDFSAGTKDITKATTDEKDAIDDLAKSYAALDKKTKTLNRQKQTADLKKLMGMGDLAAIGKLSTMGEILPQETIDRFKELGESIKAVVGVTPQYFSAAIAMREINENVGFGLQDQSAKWKELSEGLINHGEILAGIGVAMVGTFEGVAAAGGGFKELADDVLGSLKRIVGGLIKAGVAAVVQGALIKNALLGAWAIPLGIAAGSLAQIAFNSILNKIQPPALAQGGVLTSPQLVMAGEYAGARTNPEIVTPENKMRDVFKDVMRASSNNGVNGQLVAVVRGDDLLFVMEKAQNKAARKR